MLPTVYNECDIITSRRNGVFITEEINFACKNTSQNLYTLLSNWTENVGIVRVRVMVFNATFSDIVVETRGVMKKHRPAISLWQTLPHNAVSPEWDSNWQL